MPVFSQYAGQNPQTIFNTLEDNISTNSCHESTPLPIMSRQITAHCLGTQAAQACNNIVYVFSQTLSNARDADAEKIKQLTKALRVATFDIKATPPNTVIKNTIAALIQTEKAYDATNELALDVASISPK